MFKNHPSGLPYLFFTEMWERFGYYLMIGIFTLYLKDAVDGFGMTEAEASNLYGTFIALVFLTPFIGGLLADKWLGYRRAIIIGGLMMGVGYLGMGVHSLQGLYIAMTLVILGNGFFKPNISTILGRLYNDERYQKEKDSGYNIFYMGINIGAFICNFFGAAMQNIFGWAAAFMTAGAGMFIGVAIFIIGTQHYIQADIQPKGGMDNEEKKMWLSFGGVLLASFVMAIIGYFIPGQMVKDDVTDAFLFACLPIIGYYVNIYLTAAPEEKRPISALLVIFAVTIPFWAVFKQNGSALTTWADKYTDRSVTASLESPLNAIKLLKTIPFKDDSIVLTDAQFRPKKENNVLVKTFGKNDYFKNIEPDKRPEEEGSSIKVWATNLSQSINPGWVVVLTPLVVGFFAFLRRKKKEPTTPQKIGLGLLISALSSFCMVAAVYTSQNGMYKSSPLWLIATYGVITIGELCLSPMGLSLVSKLSPPRITAIMMGGWFLSTSIGNKLSGVLASMWDGYDDKANFFYVNFAFLGAATLVMFLLLRWLNVIFREYVGEGK